MSFRGSSSFKNLALKWSGCFEPESRIIFGEKYAKLRVPNFIETKNSERVIRWNYTGIAKKTADVLLVVNGKNLGSISIHICSK